MLNITDFQETESNPKEISPHRLEKLSLKIQQISIDEDVKHLCPAKSYLYVESKKVNLIKKRVKWWLPEVVSWRNWRC